jgi:general secretion pathway protein J
MMTGPAWPKHRAQRGFTLIELLVAISVMALMAVLSWQGLDGMTRAQAQLQQRADEVLTLQAGLNQWGTDLDAIVQIPQTPALDWDGRALRLTRRSLATPDASRPPSGAAEEVMRVVAWARRDMDGNGHWLRWQSPPLRTRGDVQAAWALAAQWAQNPGDAEKRGEVRVALLSQWQVFFYRGGAWTNPLSSTGDSAAVAPAPVSGTPSTDAALPDGVRLVLTLPDGQAIAGTLTRDWVRPTLGGGKS